MGVPTNYQVCSTFIRNSGRLTYPYSNVKKNCGRAATHHVVVSESDVRIALFIGDSMCHITKDVVIKNDTCELQISKAGLSFSNQGNFLDF